MQKHVSFLPQLEWKVHQLFKQRCAKRLSDMLTKVRKRGTRPSWMGEEAYNGLLSYWRGSTFKKISSQNKTNRASTRGGAVHTSGRKSHLDVAMETVSVNFHDFQFLSFLCIYIFKTSCLENDRLRTCIRHNLKKAYTIFQTNWSTAFLLCAYCIGTV